MKTYEMVPLADENGLTYIYQDMRYSSTLGFHHADGEPWEAIAYAGWRDGLNRFVHTDGWEEFAPQLTLTQLYNIVGYVFELIPEPPEGWEESDDEF